jgi:hypothetical protein
MVVTTTLIKPSKRTPSTSYSSNKNVPKTVSDKMTDRQIIAKAMQEQGFEQFCETVINGKDLVVMNDKTGQQEVLKLAQPTTPDNQNNNKLVAEYTEASYQCMRKCLKSQMTCGENLREVADELRGYVNTDEEDIDSAHNNATNYALIYSLLSLDEEKGKTGLYPLFVKKAERGLKAMTETLKKKCAIEQGINSLQNIYYQGFFQKLTGSKERVLSENTVQQCKAYETEIDKFKRLLQIHDKNMYTTDPKTGKKMLKESTILFIGLTGNARKPRPMQPYMLRAIIKYLDEKFEDLNSRIMLFAATNN